MAPLFISLIISIFCSTSSQLCADIQPTPSTLHFIPTANPTFNNEPSYHNKVKPRITCTSTSLSYALAKTVIDYIHPLMEKVQHLATQSTYALIKRTIKNFLWNYRYVITGYAVLSSYVITSAVLIADYCFMKDSNRWSQWRHEYSFEQLCSAQQHQLTKDLLITINRRYCNNENPTDFNHPLIIFIRELNNELYRINRYITVTSFQKRLHIAGLFPISDTKIQKAQQLLARAHFIKHLFLSWLAEYNVVNGHADITTNRTVNL